MMRHMKLGVILLVNLLWLNCACAYQDNVEQNDTTSLPNPTMQATPQATPQTTPLVTPRSSADVIGNHYTLGIYFPEQYPGYEHLDGYQIGVARVDGMTDSELQDKINKTLWDASLSWVDGILLKDLTRITPVMTYHSPRYLGVTNCHPDNRFYKHDVFDFITVDMQTGERVFLNDLVSIDDDFVQHIKTGRFVYGENTESALSDPLLRDFLAEMTNEELLDALNECSDSQLEVFEKRKDSIEETIGPLLFRYNFYIQPGRLVIWEGNGHWRDLIFIDLDDIQGYLKVEPW